MRPTRSNTTVSESGETTKFHVMNIPASRLDIRKNSYNVRIVRDCILLAETESGQVQIDPSTPILDPIGADGLQELVWYGVPDS